MNRRSTLYRLGLATSIIVAGTGLALATAAPAQAAVVTTPVAAAPGDVDQVATATCPPGQFLSGAGGAVAGGNGDVTLTDVTPDLGTATVTVWGHANPGAVPGAYTVVAQAICVPGPPPANYQLVTAASPLNPDPVKTEVAVCPAGTRLLGLGNEIRNADGQALYQSSEPDPTLNFATVRAGATGGFVGNWRLIAYGICGTPPPGVVPMLYSATGPLNSADPKLEASPACPAGSWTTGVGGAVRRTAIGTVLLSGFLANGAQDMATTTAVEDGLYLPTWDLTAHNICWG